MLLNIRFIKGLLRKRRMAEPKTAQVELTIKARNPRSKAARKMSGKFPRIG